MISLCLLEQQLKFGTGNLNKVMLQLKLFPKLNVLITIIKSAK